MPERTDQRVYDGTAIVALAVGLAGLLAMATIPLLAFPIGVAAVALALVSRTRLRADDGLRGAGLGLAAFLIGVVGAASVFFPPFLTALIAGLHAIPVG